MLHFYSNELRELEHVFNIISVNIRSPLIAMVKKKKNNNRKRTLRFDSVLGRDYSYSVLSDSSFNTKHPILVKHPRVQTAESPQKTSRSAEL